MLRRPAALALFLLTCGCQTPVAARGAREITVREYVFGAFGGAAVDLRDICPSGRIRHASVRRGASDYVLSVVSLGLYLPYELRVACEGLR